MIVALQDGSKFTITNELVGEGHTGKVYKLLPVKDSSHGNIDITGSASLSAPSMGTISRSSSINSLDGYYPEPVLSPEEFIALDMGMPSVVDPPVEFVVKVFDTVDDCEAEKEVYKHLEGKYHQCVIRAFKVDSSRAEYKKYLILEAGKKNLKDLSKSFKSLMPIESRIRITLTCFRNILQSMHFFFENNIIYDDTNPENFVIGQDGFIKAIDLDTQIMTQGMTFSQNPFKELIKFFSEIIDISENIEIKFLDELTSLGEFFEKNFDGNHMQLMNKIQNKLSELINNKLIWEQFGELIKPHVMKEILFKDHGTTPFNKIDIVKSICNPGN